MAFALYFDYGYGVEVTVEYAKVDALWVHISKPRVMCLFVLLVDELTAGYLREAPHITIHCRDQFYDVEKDLRLSLVE